MQMGWAAVLRECKTEQEESGRGKERERRAKEKQKNVRAEGNF